MCEHIFDTPHIAANPIAIFHPKLVSTQLLLSDIFGSLLNFSGGSLLILDIGYN